MHIFLVILLVVFVIHTINKMGGNLPVKIEVFELQGQDLVNTHPG